MTPRIKISRIGMVTKANSPFAKEGVSRLKKWCAKNGIEAFSNNKTIKMLKNKSGKKSLDALVVLGGDGTFLSAARMATNHSVPLLGVNLGSLGFITEIAFNDMEGALRRLLTGEFEVEKRMMLNLEVKNRRGTKKELALNEVVFTRKTEARMIELSVSVNGKHVTRYKADGLIVATPTGSTAYALSVGGPILLPPMDAILICPISPHTLTNRPLVIPCNSKVEVKLDSSQKGVIATLDGQTSISVSHLDRLMVGRSKKVTRFMKVPDHTHFDILRSKLGWGGTHGHHI